MADDSIQEIVGRCGFFLKRKSRYCKMIPGKGRKYCGEHSYLSKENESPSSRKRIPCPLDTKHTVFEDQLEKHLKKCNVTKKRQVDYYQAHINSGMTKTSEKEFCCTKLPLRKIPNSDIQTCVNKLKSYFNGTDNTFEIKKSVLMDNNLQDEIDEVKCNQTSTKHLQQQSSLIGNLRNSQLLTPDTIFVEFGAGRGLLSHWVQKAAKDQSNVDFLLVDRASARYKADSYHRGADQGPSFNRIQIDIEHLNLRKVPLISQSQQGITGISKHLCGAATDLALRCLLGASHHEEDSTMVDDGHSNSRAKKRFKIDHSSIHGLLFALCCHHCCSWTSYVGKDFLENLGFTEYHFHILCCLSSWATCGSRAIVEKKNDLDGLTTRSPIVEADTLARRNERKLDKAVGNADCHSEPCESSEEHGEIADEESCIRALGLSKAESEEIGRQSKHLIDAGRVWFLEKHGMQASLVYYVERSVSLENVALVAWNRDRSQSVAKASPNANSPGGKQFGNDSVVNIAKIKQMLHDLNSTDLEHIILELPELRQLNSVAYNQPGPSNYVIDNESYDVATSNALDILCELQSSPPRNSDNDSECELTSHPQLSDQEEIEALVLESTMPTPKPLPPLTHRGMGCHIKDISRCKQVKAKRVRRKSLMREIVKEGSGRQITVNAVVPENVDVIDVRSSIGFDELEGLYKIIDDTLIKYNKYKERSTSLGMLESRLLYYHTGAKKQYKRVSKVV